MSLRAWSVDELAARYDLEPELADVFVEGGFDREILSQCKEAITRGIAFYEIDVVDIPSSTLAKHGLTSGNKQRLIALAKELSSAFTSKRRVTCLVDRDLDHWFGELPAVSQLRWSAYCCIEMHFLTSQYISDVLITTGRAKIPDIKAYAESLQEALRSLFALRLADRSLELSLRWIPLKKYLSKAGSKIHLDVERYAKSLLLASGKARKRQEFESAYLDWLGKLGGDHRLCARGHDYTELLAWSIGEFKGQAEIASPAAVERMFVLLARSVDSLAKELEGT